MESREVVVTGLGAVAPNGIGREAFWEGVTEGKSGVRRLDHRFDEDDLEDLKVEFAATVDDFDPSDYFSDRVSRRMDIFVQYGVVAAEEAMRHAGFDLEDPDYDPDRVGVVIGSGIGGLQTIESEYENFLENGPRRVSAFLIPKLIINMGAAQVSIRNGCRGPNKAVVTACATGNHAIGDAARVIERGEAEVMVAGGAEAGTTPLAMAGFCAIRALSTRNEDPQAACRPFDRDRDGFVMGEGAGSVVLESRDHAEARGAEVLASLVGYGQSGDAHHITAPREDGYGASECMERALEDASLPPERVDYINAHGTSTPMNDATETRAIRSVFEDHAEDLKVSSTKSSTGHLLGAAGAIEAVACIQALQHDVIPPTINYETPDPDCDLDYVPNEKQETEVNVALSNTFGFGGHNATLIFTA